ncbi:UNVERIFIED_CONTAM: hypothetical protein PYX00_006222 [Menopon gallinae]|uniref:PDZ domain-containing protein n=1 Tax=Menopon gallinae TaxID=328185 RepID=A0AAW2HUG4_9NEOP
MFSSLKLNSLKCQSNSASEKKKDKYDEDEDDVSEHMYEKLPNYDSKTCKCHSNYISRSPKSLKTSFSKRISKWRMECPGITNLRISRPDGDLASKNNQDDTRDLFSPKSNIRTKVTTVSIEREDGNLGITLRGGFQQNADSPKPVTITYVKPDGPAAREGTIKCGDRLLAVDGIPLQGRSLSDAQTLLRQPTPSTLLTIEYDVNVLDTVEHASGPLLIEMELNSFHELGVRLGQNENGIIIGSVKPGSLADRCGALHVGDEILAVNSTRIDCTALVVEDLIKFIECSCPMLRLEILPSYATLSYTDTGTWRSKDHLLTLGSTMSGLSTLKSHAGRRNHDCKSADFSSDLEKIDYKSSTAGPTGFHGSNMALTHSETIHTTLYRENGIFGLECMDSSDGTVIISSVIHGSPAEKSQCLYPGDRIISINNRNVDLDNLTAKDINELLEGKSENVPCMKLSIHTEFDVLDSVIPASGIFTVKLAKHGSSGLGITITASKNSGFMVCEMKKGSIAYRAGSLIPGDKILAINNIPLNQCSVEYAAHILHQSSKIVTLRVQRKDNTSDVGNVRKVTYTVELQRYGGPLGITIAGSEEPFHPITISGLSSGGLGEQTGVLHIGDEILAINNHSLYGEPLSKAHQLLQNSPDFVTLKISRSIMPYSRFSNNISPIMPPSVDSAVESWDSSRLDLTSSPEYHQKTVRDSRDCLKKNIKVKQLWSPLPTHFPNELTNDLMKPQTEGEIPDLSLLDEITSENLKIKKELDLLSLKLESDCKMNINEVNENGQISKSSDEATEEHKQNNEEAVNSPSENETNAANSDVNTDFVGLSATEEEKEFSNGYKDHNSEFTTNDFENLELSYLSDTKNWFKSHYLGNDSNPESIRNEFHNSQLYKVTLHKDPIYEDFGFSVSDGLYERGVFINRIRRGGPADINNVLKPYDRILQVNETFTQDFDCCLTVPLIASAGDSITLLVARNSTGYLTDNVLDCEKVLRQECSSSQTLTPLENDIEGSQKILV